MRFFERKRPVRSKGLETNGLGFGISQGLSLRAREQEWGESQ